MLIEYGEGGLKLFHDDVLVEYTVSGYPPSPFHVDGDLGPDIPLGRHNEIKDGGAK